MTRSISEIKDGIETYEFLSLEIHGVLMFQYECLSDDYHHKGFAQIADNEDPSQRIDLHLTVSEVIAGLRLQDQVTQDGNVIKFEHFIRLQARILKHPTNSDDYILIAQEIQLNLPIPLTMQQSLPATQYTYKMILPKSSQRVKSRSRIKWSDVFVEIKKDGNLPVAKKLTTNTNHDLVIGRWVWVEGKVDFAFVEYGQGKYSVGAINLSASDTPPLRIALEPNFFEDFDDFCIKRWDEGQPTQTYFLLGQFDLIRNNSSLKRYQNINKSNIQYMLKNISHIIMNEKRHILT